MATTSQKRSTKITPRTASEATRAAETTRLTSDEQLAMVAQAAYFRAEKRGFAPGGELGDWLEAEQEIAQLLGQATAMMPQPARRTKTTRASRDN